MTAQDLATAMDLQKNQLAHLTEVEIDRAYAALDEERFRLKALERHAFDVLHRIAGDKKERTAHGSRWSLLDSQAHDGAAELGTSEAAEALGRLVMVQYRIEKIDRQEAHVLDAEYHRRGGWERAFLVEGPGGHVHKTRGCHTCFATTRFIWMIDYSGKTEAEIVAAAGERACTVCYPSAPATPTKMYGPNEVKAQQERAEREQARQAKKDEAAAKAIMDAFTGAPLRDEAGNKGSLIKTVVSAKRELASEAWWVLYCLNDGLDAKRHRANVLHLAAAIGAKEEREMGPMIQEAMEKKAKEFGRTLAKAPGETRKGPQIARELLAAWAEYDQAA